MWKRKSPTKKIKGWMYGVTSFVLMIIAIGCTPTSENSKGTAVQNYLKKQGVKKLDYLILTHTDADHIGGADVIITKFDVDTLFIGDFKKENKTYAELINAINYKGLQYSTPAVGNEYTLGNAVFTILAPNTVYDDPNNSSIAILLRNGDNRFLFTGDCEEESETLNNLRSMGVKVFRTDEQGSIVAYSNGIEITWNCAPSDTWKAGE